MRIAVSTMPHGYARTVMGVGNAVLFLDLRRSEGRVPCDEPHTTYGHDQYADQNGEHDEALRQSVHEDGKQECSHQDEHPVGRALKEILGSLKPIIENRVAAAIGRREHCHACHCVGHRANVR